MSPSLVICKKSWKLVSTDICSSETFLTICQSLAILLQICNINKNFLKRDLHKGRHIHIRIFVKLPGNLLSGDIFPTGGIRPGCGEGYLSFRNFSDSGGCGEGTIREWPGKQIRAECPPRKYMILGNTNISSSATQIYDMKV